MGRHISQQWRGNPHALRASDRRGGRFNAYVPHMLMGWRPRVEADVVAFLSETERILLETSSRMTPSAGGDLCFWAESLGSSRIEGVIPDTRCVVRALAKRQHTGEDVARGNVAEVIGNIDATTQAQQMLAKGHPLQLQTLLDAHRTLMDATATPRLGGVVRTEQNWIGGNDWHPLDGDFVPLPPSMCHPLLNDLMAYLRSDGHPPLLQAALAHAQFETIHPFGDGNGRVGRALLYGILKRHVSPHSTMPPISLALSRNRDVYLDALAEFQTFVGDADDPARSDATVRWLEVLATSVQQSSRSVLRYQEAIASLRAMWLAACGGRSKRSVIAAAVEYLPTNPSVTPKTLAEAIGFSQRRCGDALRRLEVLGIVKSRTVGPSLRVYDADKVFDAFNVLSSTVCDSAASAADYAPLLADPLIDNSPAPSALSAAGSSTTLCPRKVKSTGLPCGLVRGHNGYCRHLRRRRN
ncbi:MAG: Fic family protein [Acidimicrobiaceae bacterium]|nr:Fic family protein [Acidimicrobiaceae bacterium]